MSIRTSTLLLVSLIATPALAAGGGGSGGGGSAGGSSAGGSSNSPPPKMSPLAVHCKTGEVAKTVVKNGKKTTTCVSISGSNLDDRDLYHQGWVLAKAGEYDWAIEVLSSVKVKEDADVLTMLGYSNRKAGRFDVGFAYYQQALALDPKFVRAREYWGEGLVAEGKIAEAKLQLAEIEKVTGTKSAEYRDLSAAIAKGA